MTLGFMRWEISSIKQAIVLRLGHRSFQGGAIDFIWTFGCLSSEKPSHSFRLSTKVKHQLDENWAQHHLTQAIYFA